MQQTPQQKTFTFTPAQQLVISGLWSLLAAAGAATVTAVIQMYTVNGFNVPVLINIGLITFGGAFFSALKNYVPAHVKDIMQATEDCYTQVLGTHQSTIATLNNVITTLTAQSVVQPSQSQPMAIQQSVTSQTSAYIPSVVQTAIDIPAMPTQRMPIVQAPPAQMDLMANVPQNTLQSIAGGVTGQFMTAGVSRTVPNA